MRELDGLAGAHRLAQPPGPWTPASGCGHLAGLCWPSALCVCPLDLESGSSRSVPERPGPGPASAPTSCSADCLRGWAGPGSQWAALRAWKTAGWVGFPGAGGLSLGPPLWSRGDGRLMHSSGGGGWYEMEAMGNGVRPHKEGAAPQVPALPGPDPRPGLPERTWVSLCPGVWRERCSGRGGGCATDPMLDGFAPVLSMVQWKAPWVSWPTSTPDTLVVLCLSRRARMAQFSSPMRLRRWLCPLHTRYAVRGPREPLAL